MNDALTRHGMPRRHAALPTLYGVVFEIAALRAALADLPPSEVRHLATMLDSVEGSALTLLQKMEKRAAH